MFSVRPHQWRDDKQHNTTLSLLFVRMCGLSSNNFFDAKVKKKPLRKSGALASQSFALHTHLLFVTRIEKRVIFGDCCFAEYQAWIFLLFFSVRNQFWVYFVEFAEPMFFFRLYFLFYVTKWRVHVFLVRKWSRRKWEARRKSSVHHVRRTIISLAYVIIIFFLLWITACSYIENYFHYSSDVWHIFSVYSCCTMQMM